MNPSVLPDETYVAIRSTIATSVGFDEFQARLEQAMPRVTSIFSVLAAHHLPWDEVISMTADAAPHGFLIYLDAPVDRIMRFAGHHRRTCSYLIGNHVDAERMYRRNPAVMLHSPLRLVLWEGEDGQAMLTFDHPAAQFSCFDDASITAVGAEINDKFAALLRHLGLPVPDSLSANEKHRSCTGAQLGAGGSHPSACA